MCEIGPVISYLAHEPALNQRPPCQKLTGVKFAAPILRCPDLSHATDLNSSLFILCWSIFPVLFCSDPRCPGTALLALSCPALTCSIQANTMLSAPAFCCHILNLRRRTLTCNILTCRTLTCRTLTSYRTLTCRTLICRTLTCRTLSCRTLTCRTLTCRTLTSCRTLTRGTLGCGTAPHRDRRRPPLHLSRFWSGLGRTPTLSRSRLPWRRCAVTAPASAPPPPSAS